jgi:DNA-binding response OmpR family regulator
LPPILRRHDVELDPARGRATRGGRPLDLRLKEMAVLRLLLAADGAIVSAEELLEQAWDENADPFTTTVRMTVSNLRRKLGNPPLIETVTNAGYVIR